VDAEKARRALESAAAARGSAPIEVVVIGLSTGGPAALEQLLPSLPKSFPVPVLIVQHMPKLFTGALAERLDRSCALRVEQAYEDAVIRPGTVWLAPGDAHMEVAPRRTMLGELNAGVRSGRVRLHQQAPLNHCRPAVDYLFFSAARMYGAAALALVLTGMGSDGLDGARAVHEAGGVVMAQDEASSAVWGMPGRVSEAGIAAATLPLSAIGPALLQRVNAGRGMGVGIQQRVTAGALPRRETGYGLL
jgi:two-component system chemotaxis response regulator CheB